MKKKGLSLGQQMWLPVALLAVVLVTTAVLLVARTLNLVEDSRAQQET